MKFAKQEKNLRKIQAAGNLAIPILDEKPEIPSHLIWVWDFFLSLGATRHNTGYGLLPITYQEILALVSLQGICYSEDIEELLFFIPALDAEYVEYKRVEQERKAPKPKKGVK